MALNSTELVNQLVSHSKSLGIFSTTNSHEPKGKPGTGLHSAIWCQHIGPARGRSGIAATAAYVVMNHRIYGNMLRQPEDEIDPDIMNAVDVLMGAYSGDFTLGGFVCAVDLLGMGGKTLSATAGYINIDGALYRVMTLEVPLIVNDAWPQGE